MKIFVTATPEARAQRRALELAGRGEKADYRRHPRRHRQRDARDSGRAAAPLMAAPDAALLDTSRLGVEEAFAAAMRIVEARARA